MGREEIISRLKETEAAAGQRLENAKLKKAETLETARRRARKEEDQILASAGEECAAILKDARKNAEARRKVILDRGRSEAEAMKKRADTTRAREIFLSRLGKKFD